MSLVIFYDKPLTESELAEVRARRLLELPPAQRVMQALYLISITQKLKMIDKVKPGNDQRVKIKIPEQ